MHSTLLCSALLSSAFLRSALLSSPLLYCTLIYSSILHHTILCICTLREPWAECPRILQQLSYNLHRKNNTASCQRTPRIHPENLKIPSQTTPKIHLGSPPGTNPEKSSLITLQRVPQGSPMVPKMGPTVIKIWFLFSFLFCYSSGPLFQWFCLPNGPQNGTQNLIFFETSDLAKVW